MKSFIYENIETKSLGNDLKIVKKVSIINGKGYKSVTKYRKGKRISSVKRKINKKSLKMIEKGEFICGLFNNCTK
jgi:hypothetical protein